MDISSAAPPAARRGAGTPYPFPREYAFPPFYTIQPNETTRHAQLAKWSAIVLGYCAHHRLWQLSLADAVVERPAGSPYANPGGGGAGSSNSGGDNNSGGQLVQVPRDLFHNARLDRRLSLAAAREVMRYMVKEGTATPVHDEREMGALAALGLGSSAGAADGERSKDTYWVWWRSVGEWARLLDAWVEETGQRGSVLTLYEIYAGEGGMGTEFHGMDPELLKKVLAVLVKKGKAQIFGQEDSLGVKFFGA